MSGTVEAEAKPAPADEQEVDWERFQYPVAQMVLELGLPAAFYQLDERQDAARGLWPGSSLKTEPALLEALNKASGVLVADTYGGVDALMWARQAYNAKRLWLC